MTPSEAPSENAGIFATTIYSPFKRLLPPLAPGAKISERQEGHVTIFSCQWPDVTVNLAIDPQWDGRVQCSGLKGWILSFPDDETSTPEVSSLLDQIDSTVECIGTVISPGYDSDGKAASLILGLATELKGYVFAHQSIYDTNGLKIIGLPDGPEEITGQEP